MSSFDIDVYLHSVRYTSAGGALCVYKSNIEPEAHRRGIRGNISELSVASRQKLAFVASNANCDWLSMITLTYGADYPRNGTQSKRDLNVFLTRVRKIMPGIKYLWFMEFQKRGAVHYHILLSEPFNTDNNEILTELWIRLAQAYCSTETDEQNVRKFNEHKRNGVYDFWQNATSKRGLSHYAVKYATKTEQKQIPLNYRDCGRFWGASRGLVEYTEEELILGQQYTERLQKTLERRGLKSACKYLFGD